jgi:hypothetical protein
MELKIKIKKKIKEEITIMTIMIITVITLMIMMMKPHCEENCHVNMMCALRKPYLVVKLIN